MKGASLALGMILSSTALSQPDTTRVPLCVHRGLVFEAGYGPRVSMSTVSAGNVVLMGVGYAATQNLVCGLRIYTGTHALANAPARTDRVAYSLGGAGVNGVVFLSESPVRPFFSGEFALVTLLQQSGYNGRGFQLRAGMQVDMSRYFAVGCELQYARWYFTDPVGQTGTGEEFRAFSDQELGVNLLMSFHPGIIP